MIKPKYCDECWLKHKAVTLADLHIDDRDLCLAHVRSEGMNPEDGVQVVQPPARGPIAPVLQREKKAKAEPALKVAKPVPAPKPERQPRTKAAPKPKVVLEPRKCADLDCGKEFQPKTRKSVFCSLKCYSRNWYRTHRDELLEARPHHPRVKIAAPSRPVLQPRECSADGCTKVFTPKRCDQKYCSERCAQRGWKHEQVIQRQAAMPERVCQGRECQKQFVPKRRDQRFCSKECKNSARVFTTAPVEVHVKAVSLENWADCEVPGCRNKACLSLHSTKCHPHTMLDQHDQAERISDSIDRVMHSAGVVSAVPCIETTTIRVTEHMLDGFWAKLSIAEKAAIFQRELGE